MQWSLLDSLDDDERRAVLEAARRRTFAKGEIVFHEGDPSDSVHLIAGGHLSVMISTPAGDLATLNVLGPGDWFGELSMLREHNPTPRSATITSLDSSQTLVLTQAAFHQLCERHPQIESLVGSLMAARIRKFSADLLHARYTGLDQRLCGALLELVRVFDDGGSGALVPLTQDQLADLVGGTRPSINQILQRLSSEGIVRVGRGWVMVLDESALARQAGP
jgi:CRP/FNR family transcriptional regulator, cyclic AMP receptor protein